MKNKLLFYAFTLLLLFGCKKMETPIEAAIQQQEIKRTKLDSFFVSNRKIAGFGTNNMVQANSIDVIQSNTSGGGSSFSGSFEDDEIPTILGQHLANPYTLPNMQVAYQLMGVNIAPQVTDLYVKFRPNNFEQLDILDDSLDLELQDYPMDYEVLQDGDYYISPGVNMEDIPWLYTVVPADFQFPNGIPYQVIEQLHIPEDNLFLENLAESLVSGASYMGSWSNNYRVITRTDLENDTSIMSECECPDPNLFCTLPSHCFDGLPPGGGGSPISQRPHGQISVFDTHIIPGGMNIGVKNVRVIVKRWFKVDRVQTDNNGNFTTNKQFNNRYKVNVKFRNNIASIRSIRGLRIWQMLFPVHKNIGRFQQPIHSINYVFNRNGTQVDAWRTNWMRLWMAATTHNALQEHKTLAQAEGVGTFSSSNRLNVLLTNHALGIKSGAEFRAPMHKQKQKDFGFSDIFSSGKVVLYSIKALKSGGVWVIGTAILNAIKLGIQTQQPDLTFTYRTDLQNLSSNEVARNVFGAMALAALYKKTGLAIYSNITKGILKVTDIVLSIGNAINNWKDKDYPFWDALSASSITNLIVNNPSSQAVKPIYELYHGYAIYMGNFLANRKYGINSDAIIGQLRTNIFGLNGISSHIRFLEGYDPRIVEDIYRWVPIGLFYDLIDNTTNEPINFTDDVNYFTNSQMWDAISNGNTILDMQSFKTKMINLNPTQVVNTNSLFNQYGF